MAKSSPLHKVTNAAVWDAEELLGRLGIISHAAFHDAGFLHHSPPESTPWSLSRRYYVAPPAECRKGTAAAVLRLSRRGRSQAGRSYVLLRAYIPSDGGGRCKERRERLDRAALAAFLSGGLDDAARARSLAAGSAGEWLWTLLVVGICRDLFTVTCRMSGVPVQPGFASLPEEMKVAILGKLDDGKDIAMVECASWVMSDLVAKHESELWKPRYQAIVTDYPRVRMFVSVKDMWVICWKEMYLTARRFMATLLKQDQPTPWRTIDTKPIHPFILRVLRRGRLPSIAEIVREKKKHTDFVRAEHRGRSAVEESNLRWSAACRRGRTVTVPRKSLYRKGHGVGAVHSPSSKYHWRHR